MASSLTCAHCGLVFQVFDEDRAFYEIFQVPEPKNCPECRLVRRLMERNTKHLTYRACDLTGERMLSQYTQDQPFPVYSPKAWWGDSWDGLSYGRDIDWNRPFFEQFYELKKQVPHCALFVTQGTIQNSDFNNCAAYLKNCYLVAETDYAEDCYYSNLLKKCKSVVDSSVGYESELLYECVDVTGSYRLLFSQDCQNCSESFFLKNCISCRNCIGCINLRHKEYMIFNQPYSREAYEEKKHELELDTRAGLAAMQQRAQEFFRTQPHRAVMEEQNENSSGDHLYNSKNAFMCFDSRDLEDCRYCAKLTLGVKSSMDYNSWGSASELMYQCAAIGDHCYRCLFCVLCQTNIRDSIYCYECFSSSNCFGCVGLKKKEYCILNKQYTKEEYEELVPKLIEHMKKTGEWGEFFPVRIGAFAYNESIAQENFPLTREQALQQGYRWREDEQKTVLAATYHVPETIKEVADDVLRAVLICEDCKKNYRIIKQELALYRQLQLPLPLLCSSCRHARRMKRRNSLRLCIRSCAKCGQAIQTSYAPERPEMVYCSPCYQSFVY